MSQPYIVSATALSDSCEHFSINLHLTAKHKYWLWPKITEKHNQLIFTLCHRCNLQYIYFQLPRVSP